MKTKILTNLHGLAPQLCAILVTFSLFSSQTSAQERISGIVEFDSLVHNFGDVMVDAGPLSCTFTMKNISSKPVVIYNVTTSCGCTGVTWTKEPVRPGQTATVSASYTNDEGPYPFEKTLTVFVSDIQKPILLRLRGNVHEKQKTPEEIYAVRFGAAGFRKSSFNCGNIESGKVKSEQTDMANLSGKPIRISFADISDGLSIDVSPNPVPAGKTANVTFTVHAKDGVWGKNIYTACPVVDGRKSGSGIEVSAFVKADFSGMTKEEKDRAPRPMFAASTYSFGRIRPGTPVTAVWEMTNAGKEPLKIYKTDTDAPDNCTTFPADDVPGGGKAGVSVMVDTSGMPSGETLIIVTLTTNSPARPVVNLFITGWID